MNKTIERIREAVTGEGPLAAQSVKEYTGSATSSTIKGQLLAHLPWWEAHQNESAK